jgi:hypothetical protein
VRIILDLCGGTGSWSQPYRDAGYDVRLVTLPEHDVRTYRPPVGVHGILAAPPCTEFARVGARWWPGKPRRLLENAIGIVRACLEIVNECQPAWWCMENPIGRIVECVPELGAPVLRCNPCDFGDPWTKRMWLWGNFTAPVPCPVEPVFAEHQPPRRRDRTSMMSSSWREERAKTSSAFARAFFEANP